MCLRVTVKHTFTPGSSDASKRVSFVTITVSRFLVLVTKVNVMAELTPFVNHQVIPILYPCHQRPQLENLLIPKCFDFFPHPIERIKIQCLEIHSSLKNETSDIVNAVVNLVEKLNTEDKVGFCVCVIISIHILVENRIAGEKKSSFHI